MQRESPLDKSNLFRFELSVTGGEGLEGGEGVARKSPSLRSGKSRAISLGSASNSRHNYLRFPINFPRNYDAKNHRVENDRRECIIIPFFFLNVRDAAFVRFFFITREM